MPYSAHGFIVKSETFTSSDAINQAIDAYNKANI